jgi:DNA-binding XRE family transcriptional regulator
MKITTNHSASSYGFPVVLNDNGEVMNPGPGCQAARERLGLSRAELAELSGLSPRTIEGYEHGRPGLPANLLIVLCGLLRKKRS